MGRTRVQFDMTPDQAQHLDTLIEELGLKTRQRFFDEARVLLEWAIDERRKGNIIASVSQDGSSVRQVLMPCLEAVRPKSG